MGKHRKGMMKEEDDEENFPADHFHEIENQQGVGDNVKNTKETTKFV
jgi:hypothetical protein